MSRSYGRNRASGCVTCWYATPTSQIDNKLSNQETNGIYPDLLAELWQVVMTDRRLIGGKYISSLLVCTALHPLKFRWTRFIISACRATLPLRKDYITVPGIYKSFPLLTTRIAAWRGAPSWIKKLSYTVYTINKWEKKNTAGLCFRAEKKPVLSMKTCKAQTVEVVKTALSRGSKVLFHLSSISNHNVGALRQKRICNLSPCPNFPF